MQMRVKPQPDIAFDAVENFRLRVVRGYKRYTTVRCHALHGFRFLLEPDKALISLNYVTPGCGKVPNLLSYSTKLRAAA